MRRQRISDYRFMWVICFFDLPVLNKQQQKAANRFRKFLQQNGFMMLQLSVYTHCCSSPDKADMYIQRIVKNLPEEGSVFITKITDKQYGSSIMYVNSKKIKLDGEWTQLRLFD